MADSFVASVDDTSSNGANLNALETATAAYNAVAYHALRAPLYFDMVATVQPTAQTHPGSSVRFDIYEDVAPSITPLDEVADPEFKSVTPSHATVTLEEYGDVMAATKRLRGTSYIAVDPIIANKVARTAAVSQDTLARAELLGGSNVVYPDEVGGTGSSKVTITASDVLNADTIRLVRARLANASVQPVVGELYRSFISPDVAHDLRSETGDANWRSPHNYVQPDQIKTGMLGAFEGFDFVETARLGTGAPEGLSGSSWIDAGVGGAVNVYPTLFVGAECLAKAWSSIASGPVAQIVIGPQVDRLRRTHPVGWYWLGGYARFREASLVRAETASSIGNNADETP